MRRGLVVAVTLVASSVAAHVAPSVDDNNRYLKLTPQKDRVRLAYTVFFGENPGARMRPGLDTDRDGTISEPEAQTFGDTIGLEVATALDVTVDGKQTKVVWSQVVVGMGSRGVRAGSFSVDLIAYFCLPHLGGHHTLQLRDRYRLFRPGETEVKIEDIPGVVIQTGRVGPHNDPSHDYRFAGPGGPLADDGIDLAFEATADAPVGGAPCDAKSADKPRVRDRPWLAIVIGVSALLAVAIGVVVWRRRRR